MQRRDFIISLSSAIVTIASGCKKPEHKIIAMVMPDEINQPGKTLFYNTVYPHYGIPYGITVKTREGRPIKIDANPSSPINPNGTNATMQGSLFSLYSPARFRPPTKNREKIELNEVVEIIKKKINKSADKTIILTRSSNSILLNKLHNQIKKSNKNVNFYEFPISQEGFLPISLFNELTDENTQRKKIIITLGADIFGTSKYSLIFQNKLFENNKQKPLILSAEPYLTQTGLIADIRETRTPQELEMLAALLFQKLYSTQKKQKIPFPVLPSNFDYLHNSSIIKSVDDNPDADFYLFCGDFLSEQSTKIASLINGLNYYSPKSFYQYNIKKLRENITQNDTVIFLDFNPYYEDKALTELCDRVPRENRISLSQYFNETAENCGIHIPETNYLENWDLHSYPNDKYLYFQQPVVQKLNKNSISKVDFLLKLFTPYDNIANEYELLRSVVNLDDSSLARALKIGYIEDLFDLSVDNLAENQDYSASYYYNNRQNSSLQLLGIQSTYNYANIEPGNPFLLELPSPVTKHCWGNIALMSETTAKQNNLKTGDIIEIATDLDKTELPLLIVSGIADNLIVSELNYESETGEKTLKAGKNLSLLFENNKKLKNIRIRKTGRQKDIPIHKGLKNIELGQNINQIDLEDLLKLKHKKHGNSTHETVFPKTFEYLESKWEMEIDLSKCTGCNACTIACQIENNIPVTGDEAILQSHDMYWLTVNTYLYRYEDLIAGEFEPMMCQHCENAPCETVCPVSATTHSPDGINEMTYNRCVGSRYCLVNCPFEIRKFNYKDYQQDIKAPLELLLNPDVTVRSRGVSEKCTFCVHRIREYEKSRLQGDRQTMVQTACQQACPTNAISFGDILSKKFKISKNSYKLLENLNTLPAISYISSFRNNDKERAT